MVADRCCYSGIDEFAVYVRHAHHGQGVCRMAMDALGAAAHERAQWKLLSRVFPENSQRLTDGAENRLTGATGGTAPVTLAYDPFGRLNQLSVSGNSTYIGHLGDQLMVEKTSTYGDLRDYAYDGNQSFFWHEGVESSYNYRWLQYVVPERPQGIQACETPTPCSRARRFPEARPRPAWKAPRPSPRS